MSTRTVLIRVATVVALVIGSFGAAAAKEPEERLPRGEVHADQALIYVVRPAAVGFAVPTYSFANQKLLGVNHGNGYFWVYLAPGEYLFWSKAENVDGLRLAVEAGQTYYFHQKIVPGWVKARTALEPLPAAEGEEMIDRCKKVSELTEKQRSRGEEHAAESWERVQKEVDEKH
jgi:hypothetical protein